MRHGSLFSGIGGFDLAAEWMGWENVFHCEWNEFGQKILKYYWPNAESFDDITKTDFTKYANTIDILTGGFPCQPYSVAGKRKGKEDERHLWPEMLRAIREIQPRYVVGENVAGIISWNGGLVFHEVQTDLENEGYEVWPFILPAASVNAPHKRERVWFIAYSDSNGHKLRRFRKDRRKEIKGISEQEKRKWIWENNRGINEQTDVTNTKCTGLQRYNEWDGCTVNRNNQGIQFGTKNKLVSSDTSSSGRIQNNEQQQTGKPKHACTSWEQFPTQSPVCSRNDGISEQLDGITFPKWRSESIKAYGNAIVPQVVLQIFKAIEIINNKILK